MTVNDPKQIILKELGGDALTCFCIYNNCKYKGKEILQKRNRLLFSYFITFLSLLTYLILLMIILFYK